MAVCVPRPHTTTVSLINAGITIISIVAEGLPWGPVGMATTYALVEGLLIRTPLLFLVCWSLPVRSQPWIYTVTSCRCVGFVLLL